MNRKADLSADFVRSILAYDPLTGAFAWRADRGRKIKAGTSAGCVDGAGYVIIKIERSIYKASRLAWLIMTGFWPQNLVDHHNCDRSDNRWSNLRAATFDENSRNRAKSVSSKTGYKGVTIAPYGRFKATIRVNGQNLHLGYYATPEDAHTAYVTAANKHYQNFARAS